MTNSTEELIKYLKQTDENKNGTIVSSYVNSILKCGIKDDAASILDYFVSQPIDFYSDYLLGIFEKWGDLNFAEQIFNTHLNNKLLKNEDYPEILELLGKLKFEPIKPILIHYAFDKASDYYRYKSNI